MKWGRGHIGTPHLQSNNRKHTEQDRTGNTQEMGRHSYDKRRTPLKRRIRALIVVWYVCYRPNLKRRLRATQSLTKRNVQNFIKKLR